MIYCRTLVLDCISFDEEQNKLATQCIVVFIISLVGISYVFDSLALQHRARGRPNDRLLHSRTAVVQEVQRVDTEHHISPDGQMVACCHGCVCLCVNR